MSTRRNFLGTLGKALGAGGLLLPWSGSGALALPTELGKAAALPVTPTALPVSGQMLRLRDVRRELHGVYLSEPHDRLSSELRGKEWRDLMQREHKPLAAQIVGRRKPTWTDCTEIAEVATWTMVRLGAHDRADPRNALVYAVLSASGVTEIFVPEIGDFRTSAAE